MKAIAQVRFSMKGFAKGRFFDRPAVKADLAAREVRALSKVGAYVRRSALDLIKRKRRPKRRKDGSIRKMVHSAPGEPPISWQSPGIRKIQFIHMPNTHSVAIGPIMFNATPDVPARLEHGATFSVWESRYYDRPMPWNQGKWTRGPVETRKRTVRIKPRPFMGPALEMNQQNILEAFSQR